MSIQLQPADIFLTRGTRLLSRAIRVFTRVIFESRTEVNHVGVIVKGGNLRDAMVVEALITVKKHKLWEHYGSPSKTEVTIYRARNLTEEEINRSVKAAEGYVGRKYGVFKLMAHFGDWLLQGAYVFRRLAKMDKYPICSWVVAYTFEKVGKSFFGVKPNAASPDDIWDYIQEHPNKFTEIYPLSLLKDGHSGDVS